MSGFFNLMSVLLGLCAWGIPIYAIITRRHRSGFPSASFGLCSVSPLFQIFEIRHRIFIGDYAALEDTIHAIVLAATVLLCITLLLHIVAYVISKIKC
jgi:hypothetical protein